MPVAFLILFNKSYYMRRIYLTLVEDQEVTTKGLIISFVAGVVTAIVICRLLF